MNQSIDQTIMPLPNLQAECIGESLKFLVVAEYHVDIRQQLLHWVLVKLADVAGGNIEEKLLAVCQSVLGHLQQTRQTDHKKISLHTTIVNRREKKHKWRHASIKKGEKNAQLCRNIGPSQSARPFPAGPGDLA